MEKSYSFDLEKILKKIRDIRKMNGFSHEYMAIELGISPSAYNKLERGETVLSLERANNIAVILEVSLADILGFNFENQFNQTNKDNSTEHLYHQHSQQIENFYQENKDVYEKLIASKDDQIQILKGLLKNKL